MFSPVRLLRWGSFALPGLSLFVCVCLSLMTLQGCAGIRGEITLRGEDDYDPAPDGGGPATCDNAGLAYPDNPFHGWPMAGRGWGDVNFFYCAQNYYQAFGRHHYGVDLDAYHGEPVYATGDATVIRASYDTTYGMGKNVKLCTSTGWCAVYMHLDEWVVEVGQQVHPGTLLGYTDNTGFSTGTHLHYQINNPAGQPVDPAPTFGG